MMFETMLTMEGTTHVADIIIHYTPRLQLRVTTVDNSAGECAARVDKIKEIFIKLGDNPVPCPRVAMRACMDNGNIAATLRWNKR